MLVMMYFAVAGRASMTAQMNSSQNHISLYDDCLLLIVALRVDFPPEPFSTVEKHFLNPFLLTPLALRRPLFDGFMLTHSFIYAIPTNHMRVPV